MQERVDSYFRIEPGLEEVECSLQQIEDELDLVKDCLLYTSDAADERSSVDLGGRRIIKKKTQVHVWVIYHYNRIHDEGQ